MRDDITKYLGTVMQSTAKTIAEKLGLDRLSVSRELNSMVGSGILERKMEGAGARHSEYVYWLTRKDAAEGAPNEQPAVSASEKSLIEMVEEVPADASPKVEKPEVDSKREPSVNDLLDVLGVRRDSVFKLIDAIDNANELIRERDGLLAKLEVLVAQKSELQQNLLKEVKDHSVAVDEANACHRQLEELRQSLAAAMQRADEWENKHAMLQQRLEQYDERQRFDKWFMMRPESKGSGDSTSLKEKMWESWFERSKLTEVAA